MIEGCDAGLILNNGAMEYYFAEAYQPIYFVANSNLTETDTVMVRVGLIEGGGSSRPVNKGGEEKEAIITNPNKNKKEPEPLPMNPSTYCFPENFWTPHDLEGVSKVVVGDGCEDYICNEVILRPSFRFEHFPNGSFNNDACTIEQNNASQGQVVSGVFSVMWSELNDLNYFNINNINACYVHNFNIWRFGHKLPLFPYFKTIMDVCITNVTNVGQKPLNHISEITTVYNDTKLCDAKKDLEGHKSYPSKVRAGGYIFLEVEMAHENAHGQDFQWVIDSLQNVFLYPTLDLLEVTCGSYDQENKKANNQEKAKLIYFNYLQKIVAGETVGAVRTYNGFEQRLKIGYENHINQSFIINGQKVDHENYINGFPIVTNRIDVLLNEFENIWDCN